jgi:septal ring factor EnvC (AmiA/AmiB activator)
MRTLKLGGLLSGLLVLLLLVFSFAPCSADGGYTVSTADMQELLQIISDCRTDLTTAQDSLNSTQKDLKTASERVKELEISLAQAKAKSNELTTQLQTQVGESRTLLTQLEDAKKDLDELIKSYEALRKQIRWLKFQRWLFLGLGFGLGYAASK